MSELIFVTTDNCELCKKAENKIKFLKPFYQIREVDVQKDHKDFLLRVPAVSYTHLTLPTTLSV